MLCLQTGLNRSLIPGRSLFVLLLKASRQAHAAFPSRSCSYKPSVMWWLFPLSCRCYLPDLGFFFSICSKGKDCLQACFLVNCRSFTQSVKYQRSPGERVTELFLMCLHRNLRCNWTTPIRWWPLPFVKVLLSHNLSSPRLFLTSESIQNTLHFQYKMGHSQAHVCH